ncbi:DUF2813 domain-containing protein [Serratia ureilytica]|nr:DUF2813 domain-containing protein [Serratia ureilytica]
MFLERIEIVGFRGINRLSLMLDDNSEIKQKPNVLAQKQH